MLVEREIGEKMVARGDWYFTGKTQRVGNKVFWEVKPINSICLH